MNKLSVYLIAICLLLATAGCGQPVVDTRSDEAATPEAHSVIYGKIREANGNEITVALLNYNESSAPGGMGSGIPTDGAPSGEAAGPAGGAPSDATIIGGANISPPAGATAGERAGSEAPTGRIMASGSSTGGEASTGEAAPNSQSVEGGTPTSEAAPNSQNTTGEAPAGGRGQRGTSGQGGAAESAGNGETTVTSSKGGTAQPAGSGEITGAPGEGMFFSEGGGASTGGRGGPGVMIMGGAPTGSAYTLTGEDATFIIPVTAVITSGQGDATRTVRFTQLSYKNVVKLSLDAEGNIFAVQVLE